MVVTNSLTVLNSKKSYVFQGETIYPEIEPDPRKRLITIVPYLDVDTLNRFNELSLVWNVNEMTPDCDVHLCFCCGVGPSVYYLEVIYQYLKQNPGICIAFMICEEQPIKDFGINYIRFKGGPRGCDVAYFTRSPAQLLNNNDSRGLGNFLRDSIDADPANNPNTRVLTASAFEYPANSSGTSKTHPVLCTPVSVTNWFYLLNKKDYGDINLSSSVQSIDDLKNELLQKYNNKKLFPRNEAGYDLPWVSLNLWMFALSIYPADQISNWFLGNQEIPQDYIKFLFDIKELFYDLGAPQNTSRGALFIEFIKGKFAIIPGSIRWIVYYVINIFAPGVENGSITTVDDLDWTSLPYVTSNVSGIQLFKVIKDLLLFSGSDSARQEKVNKFMNALTDPEFINSLIGDDVSFKEEPANTKIRQKFINSLEEGIQKTNTEIFDDATKHGRTCSFPDLATLTFPATDALLHYSNDVLQKALADNDLNTALAGLVTLNIALAEQQS